MSSSFRSGRIQKKATSAKLKCNICYPSHDTLLNFYVFFFMAQVNGESERGKDNINITSHFSSQVNPFPVSVEHIFGIHVLSHTGAYNAETCKWNDITNVYFVHPLHRNKRKRSCSYPCQFVISIGIFSRCCEWKFVRFWTISCEDVPKGHERVTSIQIFISALTGTRVRKAFNNTSAIYTTTARRKTFLSGALIIRIREFPQ